MLRYDFFDGDFSGQIVAPTGALAVQTEALGAFPALALHDARIRIWQGDLGAAWGGFAVLFDGRIETQPDIADGLAQLSIGVDDSWLDKPFLGTYAGTGGIEGGAEIKGAVKPRLFGAPRFADAVLIDAVNNVWQLSVGPINQVELAFDRLSRFGAPTGDHASLAALIAATIAPGSWATCLASGLVRFGAPGDGLLTFHARGDSGGTGGWVRKPGAIISRIAEIMGASAKVNAASLTALDSARPWNISLAVREQTTPRELILSIAQSVVATPVIDWLGQLHVHPVPVPESATPVGTLAADGSALPPVARVAQQPIAPPFWRVAQQAEVTQRVHADSEIATIDLATAGDVAAAQAAADAAQADADAALTTLTNIASDSLLTPDEKPRVIQDRDAIVAEQSGIDAQATAFSITTEKTTYDTAVSALTTYLATLTSPVLWSTLTGNTTIVGSTFRQKFLDVYAARQALLNKIAAEAAKRADWSLLNGVPYDEIFNSDDDVVLGLNPVFAAWSGSYPDGYVNWVGGAPTKETSIVRVGSNAVRMTASGSDRGIQIDAINFTSTPLPAGTFLSGAVDFYLAARTSGLPGILVRLYTNAARTTLVDTVVQPGATTGAWQRVPWTARVGAGQQIYGIRIYVMASWTAFPSGSFTGDAIFGDVRFGLFDATTDNKAVSIAADGTLSGAGGGAVTITGLGYSGDLNATRNVVTYSATAPSSPANGDLWVDTSGTFAVFKLRSGGAWVTGANALSAYNTLSGKPVALADINTTESSKLAGIAAGATVGAPSGTNVGSTPATTVESGANKGNAGLDSAGNVLGNKVDTTAVVVGALSGSNYVSIAGLVNTSTTYVTAATLTITPDSADSVFLVYLSITGYQRWTVGPLGYHVRVFNGPAALDFDLLTTPEVTNAYTTATTWMAEMHGLAAGVPVTLTLKFKKMAGTGDAVIDRGILGALELKRAA